MCDGGWAEGTAVLCLGPGGGMGGGCVQKVVVVSESQAASAVVCEVTPGGCGGGGGLCGEDGVWIAFIGLWIGWGWGRFFTDIAR